MDPDRVGVSAVAKPGVGVGLHQGDQVGRAAQPLVFIQAEEGGEGFGLQGVGGTDSVQRDDGGVAGQGEEIQAPLVAPLT